MLIRFPDPDLFEYGLTIPILETSTCFNNVVEQATALAKDEIYS
jgi:hypothetical protein